MSKELDKPVDGTEQATNAETVPTETPETTPEVKPEGNTPDNTEIIDIIKRFAPDADTSTPEAIIASATTVLKSMVPVYDKLYDVAMVSPETAACLNDILETGDMLKSVVRNFGHEELESAMEEMKTGDDFEEARNAHAEKVNGAKQRMTELEANKANSQLSAQEFVDKVSPSDEDLDGFTAYYESFLKDAFDNKMTFDHWMRLWKGYKYDGTMEEMNGKVTEAEENGRIAGRNEKIEQGKKTKANLAELLPEVGGGTSVPAQQKAPVSFAKKFTDGVI